MKENEFKQALAAYPQAIGNYFLWYDDETARTAIATHARGFTTIEEAVSEYLILGDPVAANVVGRTGKVVWRCDSTKR